ncbi:hypothetical protein C8T65DRAFT_744436 [Cerioporus squamosus]|nr:hypothetical protein C8T65DRAFT_744436 [Cerioporus squamosus]
MLYHLQPSEVMTGGPWYTDNELDTEFIKLLCSAYSRACPNEGAATSPRPGSSSTLSLRLRSIQPHNIYGDAVVLVVDGAVERVPAFVSAFKAATWDLFEMVQTYLTSAMRSTAQASAKPKRGADEDPDLPSHDRTRSKRPRPASPTDTHSEYKQEEGPKSSRHRAPGLDSDTDGEHPRRSSSTKRERSCSPGGMDITVSFLHEDYGAYTYRAVRQEHAAGGLSHAPCVRNALSYAFTREFNWREDIPDHEEHVSRYSAPKASERNRNVEDKWVPYLGSWPSDLLAARRGSAREVDRIIIPLPIAVDPDCRIELRNMKTGDIGFQLTNKLHNADRRIAAINETIDLVRRPRCGEFSPASAKAGRYADGAGGALQFPGEENYV